MLSWRVSRWLLGRLAAALVCSAAPAASAWDYAGHRIVTELAFATVPAEFPAFAVTPAARERVAFLSGEPDRWRNTADLPFRHANEPDHYFDVDELPLFGLSPDTVSPFRYEFVAQLVQGRLTRPTNFPPIDPLKNADKTRELVGFLPWTLTEWYAKLKSAFGYLRAFEQHGGTADEIAHAQANVIYAMGVLSHFVADSTQPLHTTKHYNGWVGPNPHGYTTSRSFHWWIDGGFIQKTRMRAEPLRSRLRPARVLTDPRWPGLSTNIFPAMMAWVQETAQLVEPLYQLDKAGRLSASEKPGSPGYEFIARQLVVAAQRLGDLWLTAWRQAPADRFLERELGRRRQTQAEPVESP